MAVFRLPIRDGNRRTCLAAAQGIVVFRLPIRDGNSLHKIQPWPN